MAFRFVDQLKIGGINITYTPDNTFNECVNYILSNPYSRWNKSTFIDWNIIQYADAPIGFLYQNRQIVSTDPMTILPVNVGTGEFTKFGKIGSDFECLFTLSDQSTMGDTGGGQPTSNNAQSFAVLFFVDEEAEELIIGRLYRSNFANFSNFTFNSTRAKQAYQEFWLGIKPIQYNWRSFPSVTGKNGTFNFTMLKDEEIIVNAPMTYTDPSKFSAISFQTTNVNLLSGVPAMNEVYPIYAGKVDRMGIRFGYSGVDAVNIVYTYDFFHMGQDTPFLTKQWTGYSNVDNFLYLAFIVDDTNQVARCSLVEKVTYGGFDAYSLDFSTASDSADLYIWLHSHSESPDVNEPEPDGEVNPTADIGITGLTAPTTSACDTGFTSMYKVSDTSLKTLAQFLWSDNFVDNVKKFFNDPREIIIGLSIMPIDPDVGSAKNISAGGIDTGIQGLPLTSQYKLVSMGSITINEEKTAKFLNYPPNTKITASLPYVGEHALDVNDVMGKTLTLTYLFDFLNGCCVAELKVGDGPKAHRYFYGGSCAVQIPTSAEDFGRQYSSILASGAAFGSVLATPLTGGLSAPMAIGAAANILSNNLAMSPNVQYNSGGGSVNGFLSSQTAYIIIEQPNEKRADSQSAFIGRPSYIKKQLSSVSGFNKCYNVHLLNMSCTQDEKDEIESNLKAGVLIETGSPTPTVTPVTSGNLVIACMKMQSENNVIGKHWDEGTDEAHILKLEGKLIYNQSVRNPKIIVYGDMLSYNYCYLSFFNRFYYIKDITVQSSQIMELTLQVDPLQSFKTEILNNYAILERSGDSNAYNSYFNDGQYWTQQNKTIKFIPFLNNKKEELTIPRNANTYILTIAGGD